MGNRVPRKAQEPGSAGPGPHGVLLCSPQSGSVSLPGRPFLSFGHSFPKRADGNLQLKGTGCVFWCPSHEGFRTIGPAGLQMPSPRQVAAGNASPAASASCVVGHGVCPPGPCAVLQMQPLQALRCLSPCLFCGPCFATAASVSACVVVRSSVSPGGALRGQPACPPTAVRPSRGQQRPLCAGASRPGSRRGCHVAMPRPALGPCVVPVKRTGEAVLLVTQLLGSSYTAVLPHVPSSNEQVRTAPQVSRV